MKKAINLKKIAIVLFAVIAIGAIAFAVTFALTNNDSTAAADTSISAADESTTTDSTDTATTTEDSSDSQKGLIAIGAAIGVGIAAAAGAIGMGIAVAKSNESMARQPEVKGDIRSTLMLGLVFIETAIIYALVIAILVVFVL